MLSMSEASYLRVLIYLYFSKLVADIQLETI